MSAFIDKIEISVPAIPVGYEFIGWGQLRKDQIKVSMFLSPSVGDWTVPISSQAGIYALLCRKKYEFPKKLRNGSVKIFPMEHRWYVTTDDLFALNSNSQGENWAANNYLPAEWLFADFVPPPLRQPYVLDE